MFRNIVERTGDAGLATLDRLSSRRGFLAKSVVAAAAAIGLGKRDAGAAAGFYCVSGDGCTVRDSPWGNFITTYPYGQYTSYNGGQYASPAYYGCVGVANGDQEYYWRKKSTQTRYVHANLLSQTLYQAC